MMQLYEVILQVLSEGLNLLSLFKLPLHMLPEVPELTSEN